MSAFCGLRCLVLPKWHMGFWYPALKWMNASSVMKLRRERNVCCGLVGLLRSVYLLRVENGLRLLCQLRQSMARKAMCFHDRLIMSLCIFQGLGRFRKIVNGVSFRDL